MAHAGAGAALQTSAPALRRRAAVGRMWRMPAKTPGSPSYSAGALCLPVGAPISLVGLRGGAGPDRSCPPSPWGYVGGCGSRIARALRTLGSPPVPANHYGFPQLLLATWRP